MRIIINIAKAELRNLFYSPIAWLCFVAFLIIGGLRYVYFLELLANMQEYNIETKADWKSFDHALSLGFLGGISDAVIKLLYIFIPLMTMGIMNREVNSGTFRLLYSSPIKPSDIVLGKFFGTLAFTTTFAISIASLMIAGYFFVTESEVDVFFGAILGFYLITGAYIAIGIFISSLTDYQIVAGVITFVILFLLQIAGTFWQQYDFVRDLTYFLSISGRAEALMSGLITTRDIIYFILIIALFLSFTVIKLKSNHERGGWRVSLKRYLIAFAVVLFLGYFSSRPAYIGYLDITRDKIKTIHPVTQEMMLKLGDEPLTVTLYINLLDVIADAGMPENRNNYLWKFWEKYVRFHPNTQFKYEYYYDVPDAEVADFRKRHNGKSIDSIAIEAMKAKRLPKKLFMTPAEIRKKINLDAENKRLVMELEYKGKKAFLRTYLDYTLPWPDEKQVSGTINRLVNDTVPIILFSSGHFERSPYKNGDRDYSFHTLFKTSEVALINMGVDVDTINLGTKDIPESTNILVIADPKSALSTEESIKIRNYLQRGGNAIFYSEPGKQDILNPLLQTIGVNIDNGIIVHPNEHEMPQIVVAPVTREATKMAGEQMLYFSQIYSWAKPMVRFHGVAALTANEVDGFNVEPIFSITGNDKYWIENSRLIVDSAAPEFSQTEGDLRKKEYLTGVKLSRFINNKQQRIIVTSDADFMSLSQKSGQSFGNAAYSWCLSNEFPKYTNKPKPKDALLTIGPDGATAFFRIYMYLVPAVTIILGVVILMRRKRK